MNSSSDIAEGLKPCPFCGDMPTIRRAVGEFWAHCTKCRSDGPMCSKKAAAITAWNTRQTLPADGAGEAVGEAGEMPGSNGGFSMAVFKASDVPIGAKLYLHPSPPVASSAPVSGDVEGLCARLERQGVLDIDDQDLTIAASTLRAQQAKITEQDAEIAKYRAGYDALNEVLKGWQERSNANQERVRVLEGRLSPFAEAARNAEISGRPPFEFVDASEYDRARQALSESPNEK